MAVGDHHPPGGTFDHSSERAPRCTIQIAAPKLDSISLQIWLGEVPRRIDHPRSGAKFMENLKGGFISVEAKLALELNGRLTRCLSGDKICTPKPN
jgi:hypothetical protein